MIVLESLGTIRLAVVVVHRTPFF